MGMILYYHIDFSNIMKYCINREETPMRICFFVLLLYSCFFLYAKDYYSNVEKTENQICINIRPLMQIKKGCNLSSATMLLQYFGIDTSPQELKAKRNRTQSYRSRAFVNQQIRSLGFNIKKLPADNISEFTESIKRAVNVGIPLWWECDLALAPASDQRRKKKIALHRRLINGYKIHENILTDIIYSDSWGEKHINKQMRINDAYRMSTTNQFRLTIIYPRDIDPAVLQKIFPEEQNEHAAIKTPAPKPQITPLGKKRPPPSWRKRQIEIEQMAEDLAKEKEDSR